MGVTKPVKLTELMESSELLKSPGSSTIAEPVAPSAESTKCFSGLKSAESVETMQSAETVSFAELPESAKIVDSSKCTAVTEETESRSPAQSTVETDACTFVTATEPTESLAVKENAEPVVSMECSQTEEAMECTESINVTEVVESIKTLEYAESIKTTEYAESSVVLESVKSPAEIVNSPKSDVDMKLAKSVNMIEYSTSIATLGSPDLAKMMEESTQPVIFLQQAEYVEILKTMKSGAVIKPAEFDEKCANFVTETRERSSDMLMDTVALPENIESVESSDLTKFEEFAKISVSESSLVTKFVNEIVEPSETAEKIQLKECMSLKAYLELTSLELQSTNFFFDKNAPPLEANTEDEGSDLYNLLRDMYGPHAVAASDDTHFNGNAVCEGDVSSTNNVTHFSGAAGCAAHTGFGLEDNFNSSRSFLDLSSLLDECVAPLPTATESADVNPTNSPQDAAPNYPEVVATSPDSTEDALQLKILPCEIVIPRIDVEYRHLLPSWWPKRKNSQSEDSTLRKKFRADISEVIPLGMWNNAACQSQSKSSGLDGHSRIGYDFSSSGFKKSVSTKSQSYDDTSRSYDSSCNAKPYKPKSSNSSKDKQSSRGDGSVVILNKTKHKNNKSKYRSGRISSHSSASEPLKINSQTIKIVPRDAVSADDAKREKGKSKSRRASNDVSSSSSASKKSKHAKNRSPRKCERSTYNPPKANFENYVIPKLKIVTRQDNDKTVMKVSESSPKSGKTGHRNDTRSSSGSNREDVVEPLWELPDLGPIEEAAAPLLCDFETSECVPLSNSDSKISRIKETELDQLAERVLIRINDATAKKTAAGKSNLKNSCLKKLSRPQQKVQFSQRHTFQLIEADYEKWYSPLSLLPEPRIFLEMSRWYSVEFNKTKLLLLKWAHQCGTENRYAAISTNEAGFDYNGSRDDFQDYLKKIIYCRLRKVISETDGQAKTSREVEFFIDVIDTSEKDCWKISLKRATDPVEADSFLVGDITFLTLQTKLGNSRANWQNTNIFGYIEEVEAKLLGERRFLKIVLSIHPVDREVKRDVYAKVRKIINMRQHLSLVEALSVFPHSPAVEFFADSPSREFNSAAEEKDSSDEITESAQTQAVEDCYSGVYSDDPFLHFIDGSPGTGKSWCIIKLVEELCSKPVSGHALKILIISQSDAAADDLSHRLLKCRDHNNFTVLRYCDEKIVDPSLKNYVINGENRVLQRPNSAFDLDLEKKILEATKNSKQCFNDVSNSSESSSSTKKKSEIMISDAAVNELKTNLERETIIGSADVVIIARKTCYEQNFLEDFTPCPLNERVFHKFTVCIFDDANKLSELDLVIPIITLVPNLIFVGDSKNYFSRDKTTSPFMRLLEKYKKILPRNVTSLETQFRLHPKILDCLSKMNLIVNSISKNDSSSTFTLKPLMVVDLPYQNEIPEHTKLFEMQAQFCKNIIQNIRKLKELENYSIGVLVAKKQQKTIVTQELNSCPNILVEKGANFCGLEKDVIIVCLPALLYPDAFLYSAMTRGKRSLIVCSDFSQFKGQATIDRMILSANRRKCFQRWEKNPLDFPFKTMRLFLKTGDVHSL